MYKYPFEPLLSMMTFEIQKESRPTPKAIDSSLSASGPSPLVKKSRRQVHLSTGFVPYQPAEDAQEMSSNNRKKVQPLWINYMLNLNPFIGCGQSLTHTLY